MLRPSGVPKSRGVTGAAQPQSASGLALDIQGRRLHPTQASNKLDKVWL